MFLSIRSWVSLCGDAIGLFRTENGGENVLYSGEFRDCFVCISSSVWSMLICWAALLFPVSIRNVPPSAALAALFVISRMFRLEFVLSSSENLTIVSLLIL